MEIILQQVGRRFNRDWVFRGIDYRFKSGESYAVLGANGSGKSTLLQLILSNLSPSEGSITYTKDGKIIEVDDFFSFVAVATPYQELIEEFTLAELFAFHFAFKPLVAGFDFHAVLALSGLAHAAKKEIRYFSSGMKQRAKLVLACCSQLPVLLLDEPTANLDVQGITWYHDLIAQFGQDKLLIVCSNQAHEYPFCKHHIEIERYKNKI